MFTHLSNLAFWIQIAALWRAKSGIKSKHAWTKLLETAFECLDLPIAEKILRDVVRDMSMLRTLRNIPYYGDKDLVLGQVALLLGQVEKAQQFFLSSSTPLKAFELQMDLMHYREALILAARIAPNEVPFVCFEYGKAFEAEGTDIIDALFVRETQSTCT